MECCVLEEGDEQVVTVQLQLGWNQFLSMEGRIENGRGRGTVRKIKPAARKQV